jgi:hypothetical protein
MSPINEGANPAWASIGWGPRQRKGANRVAMVRPRPQHAVRLRVAAGGCRSGGMRQSRRPPPSPARAAGLSCRRFVSTAQILGKSASHPASSRAFFPTHQSFTGSQMTLFLNAVISLRHPKAASRSEASTDARWQCNPQGGSTRNYHRYPLRLATAFLDMIFPSDTCYIRIKRVSTSVRTWRASPTSRPAIHRQMR